MLLYKHGSKQGGLTLSVVKKQIEAYKTAPVEIKRIRALILKYKNSHDCVLQKSEKHYPSAANSLASPLTLFLHQQFGLEFKFFIGDNHNKPYGFVIIDHVHKTIYKGGDVFSLKLQSGVLEIRKASVQIGDESQRAKESGNELAESTIRAAISRDIVSHFDLLINNLEYQVEQDLKQNWNTKMFRRKIK